MGDVEEFLKYSRAVRPQNRERGDGVVKELAPRTFWAWLAFGLALNLILAVVLLGRLFPVAQTHSITNILKFAIPLATVHLCFPGRSGRRAKVPTILGCTTMAFALAQALFFAMSLKNASPRPGGVEMVNPWVPVGFMPAYPLVLAALLWWPSILNPPSQRFRNLLDLVVGAAGLWAFSWVFFVMPEIQLRRHNPLFEIVTLYRPIFDILLIVGLFQFFRRGVSAPFRAASRLFVIAILIIGAADVPFALMSVRGMASMGWAPSLAWPLSCTLLNLSAYLYLRQQSKIEPDDGAAGQDAESHLQRALSSQPWYSLVPYTLIPAVAFLVLYASAKLTAKPYELGVLLIALVMISCLLLRQVLAIKDNALLLTRLQDAFNALTEKTEQLRLANVELTSERALLATKNEQLKNVNLQLEQLVTIDGMTGLENHRAFQQHLRLEVDAARRHRHPLSLIMADVDFFKRYNDEFGHPAGDEVLRQIAKAIMDEVGENAYPARYGGEEFAVVLPYLTASEALAVSERIGRAVSTRIRVRRRITMSFGVATMEPNWTAETLVNEADRALYAAKGWGRNRSVLVTDLDRQRLSLDLIDQGIEEFDPVDPMGLAAILSAGLRNHLQALGIEPDSQLAGGLLGTLELKDVETRDHSERVMWYAMRLAQSVIDSGIFTMTQQELRSLAYGALLHDIGKIGVPENILKYPGALDLEMKAVIREHPRLGAQIVQRFPTLDLALDVIRNHHERWDGRGYPSGIRGMDIPLVARIFTVVDALEAMTSKRPYSDPIPIEAVTERLMAGSGTNYDPAILRAFALVPSEEWVRIRQRETVLTEQIGQTPQLHV